MRKAIVMAICAVFAAVVRAGEYKTLAFTGVGPLAYTNTQENSSWSLEGVMFRFTALPRDGSTVTVSRVSGGVEYLLSSCTNVTSSLWWSPDGAVPVKHGDAVMFRFGLDNPAGTLQIIQGLR